MLPLDRIQEEDDDDKRHMQINLYIGLISDYKMLRKNYRLSLRKYKMLRKKCRLTLREYKSRQRQLEKELPALLASIKE